MDERGLVAAGETAAQTPLLSVIMPVYNGPRVYNLWGHTFDLRFGSSRKGRAAAPTR